MLVALMLPVKKTMQVEGCLNSSFS